MKNTITKPALFQKGVNTNFNKDKEVTFLFKKYNFFVSDINGDFRAFSYEANLTTKFVEIRIKDATNNKLIKVFNILISKVCKEFLINKSYKIDSLTYEEFCEQLFIEICKHISEDEEIGENV